MSSNQPPSLGNFPCGGIVLPAFLILPQLEIPPPPGVLQLLQMLGICVTSASGSGPGGLQASMAVYPTSGTAPLTVTFTGYATGGTPPYTYDFYYGDGGSSGSSSLSSVTHVYQAAGSYSAYLVVNDSAGNTATTNAVTITVSSSSVSTQPCTSSSQCPSGYVCVSGSCVQQTTSPLPQIEVTVQFA